MSTLALPATRYNKTAVLLTASAGCAMPVLDTNVVGIVLPTIAGDLNASLADVAWVVSTYVLCFAALLLPAGSVADRYGRKRVFVGGILVFMLASLGCGLAPNIPVLYIMRAIQGAGAAFLLAPALAIIAHTFHEESARIRAWATWGGIMGLMMAVSPLVGGAVGTWLGWRWAFFINAPICAVLALAVFKTIAESRDPTPRRLDLPGMALFTAGMFLVTRSLIVGPERGWLSSDVMTGLLASVLVFSAFAIVERRRVHPMLDLAVFRSRAFAAAVLAMFAYAASAQVMAVLLPMYLQNARGATAMQAGVGMLPFAVAMMLLPYAGRALGKHWASWKILTLGLLVVALGNLLMMWAASAGGLPLLVVAMAVLGSGGGLLNGETQRAIMATIPREKAGMASGISTTARFSGVLLGFASLAGVMSASVSATSQEQIVLPDYSRLAYAAGYADAFLLAALIALVSAIIVRACMGSAVKN
ncbi:MAG: MFS transporter [Candidimonas sp.]|nr:MFS transporter [Candidimonas sp.]